MYLLTNLYLIFHKFYYFNIKFFESSLQYQIIKNYKNLNDILVILLVIL